jgi:hypothetical protein
MSNFAAPAVVKAYIDNIVRVGRTFLYVPDDAAAPYQPLAHGARMFVLVSSGAARLAGAPGHAVEARNLAGLGEGRRRQDRAEPRGQHGRARPGGPMRKRLWAQRLHRIQLCLHVLKWYRGGGRYGFFEGGQRH